MVCRGLLLALALWLGWVYLTLLAAPAIGTFHDDGVYLVSAQALAEGRGYRIVSLPWEPAQTKYPILFPWLLSLVWRVHPAFPDNLLALKAIPLACAAAWGWLSWRLLRRLGASAAVAAAILALTAASQWVAFLATTLLAETLFAALVTAGVLTLVRIEHGEGRRLDGWLAGGLFGAALLARTAGLAPAAAGLAYLVATRRWIHAARYAVVCAVIVGPWFAWSASQPADTSIDYFYSGTSYASWNLLGNFTWPEKLSVLMVNVGYAGAVGQYWGLVAPVAVAIAGGLTGSVLVLLGAWHQKRSAVVAVVAASMAMLLLWAWPPVRFIVPLLPMLLWLAWCGTGQRPRLAGALAAVLLASSVAGNWQLASAVREKGGTWFAAWGVNDWHAISEQLAWVDRETPREAIIVAVHDPTYFLFTGRKALRPFNFDPLLLYYNVGNAGAHPFGTTDDFRRRLLAVEADYVIATPDDGVQRVVDELPSLAPGALSPVFEGRSAGFAIYRVDRGRLAGGHAGPPEH